MTEIVHKALLFLLLLPTIFFGASSKESSVRQLPSPAPTPRQKGIDVISIELDRGEIVLPCRGDRVRSRSCQDDLVIHVRTTVSGNMPKGSAYSYAVTGGVIRGTGAKVEWDLSGVMAGSYTLTAAAKNNCGLCGQKKSATISVAACPDCGGDCDCPAIWVAGPANSVTAGQAAVFTANVSGGAQDTVTYNWMVSAGKIVKGQGSPSIEVETTSEMAGKKIIATVEIGIDGSCSSSCPHKASETVSIAAPK